jgi:hypothetical protein
MAFGRLNVIKGPKRTNPNVGLEKIDSLLAQKSLLCRLHDQIPESSEN